jgi:hypothetical protein
MFQLIKIGNKSVNDLAECRLEAKTILDEFYSVQFILNGKGPCFQFKLRNISLDKTCILVKQDSYVFKKLNVGNILDMEYNQPESFGVGKIFKTLISSKFPHDRYAGHSLVELSIIDGPL